MNAPTQAGKSFILLSSLAILASVAFLVAGNGLQVMLLPIRGSMEGFGPLDIGYLGSGYYLGFVLGCALTPGVIMQIGHIRTFAALVAIATAAALGFPLIINVLAWVALRCVAGFCVAGLYLVVESWLNDRATNETRGMLISAYIAVNYVAITGGQMLVTLFPPSSFALFSIAAILVSLAAVPVVMTRTAQPAPVTLVRFRPFELLRISPTGTISVFLIGLASGAFWSLTPSFAIARSGDVTVAALFVSAAVLGGAIAQWPVGLISDLLDRRIVLVALSATGAVLSFVLIGLPSLGGWSLLVAFGFGASLLSAYAIAAAHVYDFAERSRYVEISASLLLIYGLGSAIGPFAISLAIEQFGASALFGAMFAIFLSLIAFVVFRLVLREGLSRTQKEDFDLGSAAPISIIGDEQAVAESELVVTPDS